MVQLFNLNFLSAKLTQLAIFSWHGAMTGPVLLHSFILLPAALAALYLGTRLNRRINEDNYRGLLRGVLWVMVCILIGRFAIGG
jgi:uncharacterized membrane protein YfcA